MDKETFIKTVKRYKASAEKLKASKEALPLLRAAMEKEETKLIFFAEIEKRISEEKTLKQVRAEINKGLKTARRWRDDSKNAGLSCLPPVIMATLLNYMEMDLEKAAIELALVDGMDLIAVYKNLTKEA